VHDQGRINGQSILRNISIRGLCKRPNSDSCCAVSLGNLDIIAVNSCCDKNNVTMSIQIMPLVVCYFCMVKPTSFKECLSKEDCSFKNEDMCELCDHCGQRCSKFGGSNSYKSYATYTVDFSKCK
jgi:hypothetical protein